MYLNIDLIQFVLLDQYGSKWECKMITHDLKAVSCGCELYVCWSLPPHPPPKKKKERKKREREEREMFIVAKWWDEIIYIISFSL